MLKLTREQFDATVNKLKSITDDYDTACTDFGNVHSGDWSAAEQLNQFAAPLTKATDEVNTSLTTMSQNLQKVIKNLKDSVDSIEGMDEELKDRVNAKLNAMEKSSEYTDQEKNGDWAPPSVQPEKHQRPTPLQQ